jgi:V/A-type H+-transporting ATPase subunit E
MAEELQSLLERIRRDGVEKAEAEAAAILRDARAEAARIVREAGETAAQKREQAEKEAAEAEARGRRALEQAARDLLLTVGGNVEALLLGLVRDRVGRALSGDSLRQVVLEVVGAYARAGGREAGMELLVPPGRQREIADLLLGELAAEMRRGVEVRGDGTVAAGFRVSIPGEHVEHDFSAEAIAESLGRLLRPHLAEIVRGALAPGGGAKEPR